MANIQSGASADLLTVDPTSKAARTTLYDAAGNSAIYSEDTAPSSVLGITAMGANDRNIVPLRTDRLGNLHTGSFSTLLDEQFEGGTIHPNRWIVVNTTMAATQSSIAGLTINSGAITTVSTGYMLSSAKRFAKMIKSPLHYKARVKITPYNNSVMEIGFGDATTALLAHSTGCYWQVTSTGVVQPVITYNSVDTTGTDVRSLLDTSKYYNYEILIQDDEALFTIQDSYTGLLVSKQSIRLPLTAPKFLSSAQLPAFLRVYNTAGAPATAPQLKASQIAVLLLNNNVNKQFADTMATLSRTAWEHPFTGGQNAAWALAAEAAAFTPSNTAATYGSTVLGGRFQINATASSATDLIIFAFVVPSPSTLVVTGIDIETYNAVVAVATTATVLNWAVGFNANALSLAAQNTRVTVPLGIQSFPIGAAVGAQANRISKTFRTPIVVASNPTTPRYLHIILRVPLGTATATETFNGFVNVEGYFE